MAVQWGDDEPPEPPAAAVEPFGDGWEWCPDCRDYFVFNGQCGICGRKYVRQEICPCGRKFPTVN